MSLADKVKALEADNERIERVCDVCGYQFWEHPTVPGYMWMHRICDGRLVKL